MSLLDCAFGLLMTMTAAPQDLAIESTTEQKAGTVTLRFRLRNTGSAAAAVVLDDHFCQTRTRVFDADGKELPPHDRRAAQGFRRPPDKVAATALAPGKSVEIGYFEFRSSHVLADSGPLSWDLEFQAGRKIGVEFSYLLLQERAEQSAALGAPGAAVGEWTGARVEVPIPALTSKSVQAVLSMKRTVTNPAAVGLVIEALEKSRDGDTRATAAWSLGELKAEAGVPAVSKALLQDKSREVRIHAADALGRIGSASGRPALKEASEKDSDDLVRRRAADSLSTLSSKP